MASTASELDLLKRELAQRTEQLEAVRQITAALSSKNDLDQILQETLTVCLQAVKANAGSLLLYEPEEEALVFRYVVGEAAPILTGRSMPPDKGIAGEVFRTGQPKITEDVTQDKSHYKAIDGQTHYQTRNMVTVPLKSIEGDPVGVMQILNKEGDHGEIAGFFDEHDIDTLMILSAQAASAIENVRLYLEAQLAVVVNLMGDISHDVKNMVTPVAVCAQTLEMMFESYYEDLDQVAAGLTAEQAEAIADIAAGLREFYPEAIKMLMDGADQVQARVREIADCVKGIVAEPSFEKLNLNEVVEAVVAPLQLVAERQEVGLDLTGLAADLPLADLDQKQMYNCIYNLINNAIPETPPGGRIYVETGIDEAAEFLDGAPHLRLIIGDTGRGMPEHVREKLFTKDAVSTKPGGTGLGTKIVGNVVQAHNGDITVWSEQDVGTRFTIRIPLERAGGNAAAAGN